MKIRTKNKIFLYIVLIFILFVISARIFLPDPLFQNIYSTILYSRDTQLLGGRVAGDGQWRFPPEDSIPEKFGQAIVLREDRFFYSHPGFNPISIAKALLENIRAGSIVRGGSTISMQVIRLSRQGKARTLAEKIVELYYSIGLEIKYSKSEILNFYSAHAPFGGNVVGLEAASWRYFNRSAFDLSWAEAATLAVLPNAPSLIYPGKNRDLLLSKRNNLLYKLFQNGSIDLVTYELSLLEPLPEKPYPMPQWAPHLLDYFWLTQRGSATVTTIDLNLQKKAADIARIHLDKLKANQIYNIGIVIMRPETYEVLAYIGNGRGEGMQSNANSVDMVRAKRSTGSILKPLLYAAMIEDGLILPNSLVADIPSYYENYHPENFDHSFEGVVPASMALSRSRNVPAVYMLRDYGIAPFLSLMRKTGLSTFNRSADYYGLSLILGGGEASLWELTNMYAGMVRTLLNYDRFYGKYTGKEFRPPKLWFDGKLDNLKSVSDHNPVLHAGSVWMTFNALNTVKRPEIEAGWERFGSSFDIAWKTGTSYGFKDAWAIGSTADYVVGIWVGNASGEGREGLTGTNSAAPVLFEIFSGLNINQKLFAPFDELTPFYVCSTSGDLASVNCPLIDTIYSFSEGSHSKQCTYHKIIFTDKDEKYQLSDLCAMPSEMHRVEWFVLPPVQEWYYKKNHPAYRLLPPYKEGCNPSDENNSMELIYPLNGTRLFVPVGIDGKTQEIIFELSHRYSSRKVFWHIDNTYFGQTKNSHRIGFIPNPGWHNLTAVDETGESISVRFEVVNEE